jgi:hypothetical protein
MALLASDGLLEMFGKHPHACRRWRNCPGYFAPCFVFTFVRHPLARLMSAWREKLKTGKAQQLGGVCPLPTTASFEEWVDWIVTQRPASLDKHWRPQSLVLRQGTWPDFIGKIEHLDQDWALLAAEYGLPTLPRANVSAVEPAPEISRSTRKRVADFYFDDFENFGYSI